MDMTIFIFYLVGIFLFLNEIKQTKNNLYYFFWNNDSNGQVELDGGDNLKNFDEQKLLKEHENINYYDFLLFYLALHLIHKETWDKVGGFSEEFFPGTGFDPDLNMKPWNIGVRIFEGLKD